MGLLDRGIRLSAAVLTLWLTAPAFAQESLDLGKTPAQLFASDCAICHKSVNGLGRNAGIFGLDSFLRQHYTASRESAAAISAYIQAMDRGAPPAPAKRTKRTAKGSDGKETGKKPVSAKPGEAKPADTKAEPKPETKASEAKPAESKPAEAKPAEAKPAEAKPAEAKPAEAKPDKPN